MMGVQIPTREGAILICEVGGSGRPRTCPGVYSKRLSRGQHRYGVDADWGCTRWGAQWRNLANKIESSMCGGDAA